MKGQFLVVWYGARGHHGPKEKVSRQKLVKTVGASGKSWKRSWSNHWVEVRRRFRSCSSAKKVLSKMNTRIKAANKRGRGELPKARLAISDAKALRKGYYYSYLKKCPRK